MRPCRHDPARLLRVCWRMDLFAVLPRPDFALLPLAGAVVASGRQQDVLCLGICVARRGRRRIGACLIARDGGTSQVETRRRRVQARTATSESASAWLACWHGMRAGRGFSRHEHKRDRECKLELAAGVLARDASGARLQPPRAQARSRVQAPRHCSLPPSPSPPAPGHQCLSNPRSAGEGFRPSVCVLGCSVRM